MGSEDARGIGRRMMMFGALSGLAGCAHMSFPVTEDDQTDLVEQGITVIRVTPDNIALYRTPPLLPEAGRNPPPSQGRYSYRVGPGDQLQITFFADPGGVTAGDEGTPQTIAVIDESGEFFYPFVGQIRAQGRTVSQIRTDLISRLGQFFATPQVEVAVTEFNAHRATITGAIAQPGRRTLTNVPATLLDFVNESGVQGDADLSRIQIRRGNQVYTVNLKLFLQAGAASQNPTLLSGDLINIPVMSDNKVFTFGEIQTGEIALTEARKTLVEVLAEAGGIDRIRADARGIFVFRRETPLRRGFDVYQFDLSNAATLVTASEFGMAPLDIVFVTNDPVTRWSDTVGTIVQPFDSLLTARTTARNLGD